MQTIRKCLAIASIIIGGTAVSIPEPTWSKVAMALATSLNAAALYLLKEEKPTDGQGQVTEKQSP